MNKREYYIIAYGSDGETRLDISSIPPLRDEKEHPDINKKVSEMLDSYLEKHDIELDEGESFRVGKIVVDNDSGKILKSDFSNQDSKSNM